jgi:hypothetical protein
MEIKVRTFTSTIIVIIMVLMLYSNYEIKGNPLGWNANTKVLIVTGAICIANLIYTGYSATTNNINKDNIYLFLLGAFSIASIGYTIYEWDTITAGNDCNVVIPTSSKFSGEGNNDSENYYVYRTLYLTTLIVLVVVLQFKVDDSTFSPLNMDKRTLHKVLFLLPFIMPALTELVTLITNAILVDGDTPKLKPETLLLNFIKGDSKEPLTKDGKGYGSLLRSIMPILLYLTLMGLAILSGMGKIGTDGGKTAIFIIAGFLIFFSFIMRTLFVQDCVINDSNKVVGAPATDTDDGTSSFPCLFEKYGGIQTMLNVCLIIIIIYHVDKPSYKLLFFTIILLASWALSSTYMLNADKLAQDENGGGSGT